MAKRVAVAAVVLVVILGASAARAESSAQAQYARMCANWRADAEELRARKTLRPAQQQILAELEHYIATRCAPRGL